MANTPSARKNIRHSRKVQRRNKAFLDQIKKQIKEFLRKPKAERRKELQKALDKAAGRGLVKKNKARRLNSRLGKIPLLLR